MKKVLLLVCLLVMLSLSNAYAVWTDTWAENTSYYGGNSFDTISIWWLSGAQFTTPAFTNINNPGWESYTLVPGEQAFMTGPAYTGNGPDASPDPSDNLIFDIAFEGSPSDYEILYMASLGATEYAKWKLTYDHAVESWDWYPVETQAEWQALGGGAPLSMPVLEPGSLLLVGSGLLGIVGYRRKLRK